MTKRFGFVNWRSKQGAVREGVLDENAWRGAQENRGSSSDWVANTMFVSPIRQIEQIQAQWSVNYGV